MWKCFDCNFCSFIRVWMLHPLLVLSYAFNHKQIFRDDFSYISMYVNFPTILYLMWFFKRFMVFAVVFMNFFRSLSLGRSFSLFHSHLHRKFLHEFLNEHGDWMVITIFARCCATCVWITFDKTHYTFVDWMVAREWNKTHTHTAEKELCWLCIGFHRNCVARLWRRTHQN